MGRIEWLCLGQTKGQPKQEAPRAAFGENHGLDGDCHAGPWHRQVSLLSAGDVAEARKKLPDIAPGDFAENVVVSGVDLSGLGLSSRLKLGADVVLSVTQIGKVCHTACRIGQITGDCIMPRAGLFARVLARGTVAPGDPVEVLHAVPRKTLQLVVLTISDRCSAGQTQDTAGPAAAALACGALGANLYHLEVLPDDVEQIAQRLRHYCDGHSIDLVLTVGGTGFAPRDVTPEAAAAVIERFTPGLDEAMRSASMAATPHAMLSRARSGIRGATLIVTLPGSPRAARENLEAILPALAHGLEKLRGDPSDCASR